MPREVIGGERLLAPILEHSIPYNHYRGDIMKKGIFWIIDDNLLCVSVCCDKNGIALEPVMYSAKSGDNFNHKAEWVRLGKKARQGKPYNYYRRGRVEFTKEKAVIYLNSFANTKDIQSKIIKEFELEDVNTFFKSDGSAHYQALIDNA